MQLILSGGNQQLTRVESNSKLGTRVSSRQVQVIIDGHRVRTLARPMVGPEAAQIRWVVGGRDPHNVGRPVPRKLCRVSHLKQTGPRLFRHGHFGERALLFEDGWLEHARWTQGVVMVHFRFVLFARVAEGLRTVCGRVCLAERFVR